MENECTICHSDGSKSNPILTLYENRRGSDGAHEEIRLCRTCVRQREVAAWSTRGARGQRLHEALEPQPERAEGRYLFLEDSGRIHLVRMRPNWFASHASALTS